PGPAVDRLKSSGHTPVAPPKPAPKSKSLGLVAAIVIVAVLVGVGWFLGRGSSPETPPVVVKPQPPPKQVEDPAKKLQADLAAIDAELKTLTGREAFPAAKSFLAAARARYLVPEWTQ